MLTLICIKCGQEKPADDFPINKKIKNNRGKWCLACHREYEKIKYNQNPAEKIQKNKEWREKNREKHREYLKKSYLKRRNKVEK